MVALIAGLSFVPGHALAGKVYKWVDAQGNVQYSQQPPPSGAKATTLETRKSPISDDQARKQLDKLTGRSEEDRENRNLLAKDSATGDEVAAQRKRNCETARKNLEVLSTSQRVQTKGDDGKPFYLNEEVKQKKLEETQSQIKEFCG